MTYFIDLFNLIHILTELRLTEKYYTDIKTFTDIHSYCQVPPVCLLSLKQFSPCKFNLIFNTLTSEKQIVRTKNLMVKTSLKKTTQCSFKVINNT